MRLTLAGAATPPPLDRTGRSFILLSQAERDHLTALFGGLPWIDGLTAACVIAPVKPGRTDDAMDWLDFVWRQASEDDIGKLTVARAAEIDAQLVDHLCYVTNTLVNDPEAYQPYLGGFSEPVKAATNWAHGFLCGTLLCRTSWQPLLADEDVLALLLGIFCLIREEDLPEEIAADSPLRRLPADHRERMRRGVVEMLPNIVRSLHDHALGFSADDDLDEEGFTDLQETYVRADPKSGKKYNRCCLK